VIDMSHPHRAIICVPKENSDHWHAMCAAYCVQLGYTEVAVVIGTDSDPAAWRSALAMIDGGEADLAVSPHGERPEPADWLQIDIVEDGVSERRRRP
jgi:hypothetical protein